MKQIWKPLVYGLLSLIMGLLGGAGWDKFSVDENAAAPTAQPLVMEAPAPANAEDLARPAVYDLELYWSYEDKAYPGRDVIYHQTRATITGAPVLPVVAGRVLPPIEGYKLLKVQSARFVKYPSKDEIDAANTPVGNDKETAAD